MSMLKRSLQFRHLLQLATMLLTLLIDGLHFLGLCVRPSPKLAAQNLFLRKQLALYQERHVRPQRTTNVTRIAMIWLGRWFDWLNPQERIWKWLRRIVTHNHWFATLREQIEAIRNFFRYLAGIKDQVQRLCGFKTPESLVV